MTVDTGKSLHIGKAEFSGEKVDFQLPAAFHDGSVSINDDSNVCRSRFPATTITVDRKVFQYHRRIGYSANRLEPCRGILPHRCPDLQTVVCVHCDSEFYRDMACGIHKQADTDNKTVNNAAKNTDQQNIIRNSALRYDIRQHTRQYVFRYFSYCRIKTASL